MYTTAETVRLGQAFTRDQDSLSFHQQLASTAKVSSTLNGWINHHPLGNSGSFGTSHFLDSNFSAGLHYSSF